MKRVLVTGCSSGIGRGCVEAFLSRGWHVMATLRNADAHAQGLRALTLEKPGKLEIRELDVCDPEQRTAVVREILDVGVLDVLVNNAGYGQFGALQDLSEAQLRGQLEVNFFAPALLTRDLLPALRTAGAAVLNVSSLFGVLGFPLTSAYCASKYALDGWSEALRHELQPHGVRVGVVCPGAHRTGFGGNLRWAAGASEAFGAQTQNFQRLQTRLSSRPKGPNPRAVVETVVALADQKRIPLRTFVGRDARVVRLVQGFLPGPVLDCVFGYAFGRMMPTEVTG